MITVGHFVPAYRSQIHPEIWRGGVREALDCGGHGIGVVPMWLDVNGVDRARNIAMVAALRQELDYVYMQDGDTWAEDCVIRSLVDVLAGKDVQDAAIGVCCALRRTDEKSVNVTPFRPGEVYECDAVGTGLMLIDMHRLAKLLPDGPWFYRTPLGDGSEFVGGDVQFCRSLRAAGGRVWATTMVPTRHAYLDVSALRYSKDD